jgi:hypothetical protein
MATPNLSFQNFFTTTLASGITASDTTIYLNSLPTGSEGYLVIEPDSSTNKEIIYYTSKGANFVTLPSVAAGRGVGGTTAVSHSSGVTVQMNVVAEHFEALQDGTAFAVGGIGASAYADGWTPILGSTPNTVTYNGNRNYDLVFNSVDLSSTISPGQKLKLTRTVAAPSQCTDLEASSSQYYSKTSPAGLTFTDDFTCSAWVKLESYTSGGIIARRNADTEGFSFSVNSSGQVELAALRIAGNNAVVSSYASLPLNKWVHVAASYDLSGTTAAVYFDGVEVSSFKTVTGTCTALVQGTTALVVGAGKSAGTNPFDGKIAQAAVFSSVLSAATIKAMCNQTLSGSESTLVSAYSFNGVITDLNTTTTNNLTANGSAVATNADSPFANAVTAGLQEYGVVQKVAYSTNTTVNVQVAEGCAIPTSGGVSNVYYGVGKTPYGFPTQTSKWTIEFMGLATISGTTNSVAIQNVVGLNISVPTGSWVLSSRAKFVIGWGSAGAGDALYSLSTSNSAHDIVSRRSDYYAEGASTISTTLFTPNYAIDNSTSTSYYLISQTTRATSTSFTLSNFSVIATLGNL